MRLSMIWLHMGHGTANGVGFTEQPTQPFLSSSVPPSQTALIPPHTHTQAHSLQSHKHIKHGNPDEVVLCKVDKYSV